MEVARPPKGTSDMPRTVWTALRPCFLVIALLGDGTDSLAQSSRKTPIVEAVRKTRPGIVMLKVQRPGGRKDVLGSGIIVDERGYIVTNRHVIAAAEGIKARLSDGTEPAGKVVVEIESHDLAVIRIETDKKLQALRLGPAGDLMVGEPVIAIGNPYGYAGSVSTGIISALDREVTMPSGETIGNLIQTDAGINPGNSGGPLLNIDGEVIGITVALREGAHGIAFALNADIVQQLLSKHLSAARICGVRHGLTVREKTAVSGEHGGRLVVTESIKDIRQGDELVRIGDSKIANRFDVERAFWSSKPTDTVRITVRRDGKERDIAIKLSRSDEPKAVGTKPAQQPEPGRETLPAGR
jgi:serine protease Do